MENKGLLFIPDISGFSRFVTETEIDHSRLIIQELLEILINANELALEISEIEGDAILFYKFGEPPALEAIYKQVERMFCAFHQNLIAYERNRYCQCQACMSAKELTLKVITHYGEFTLYHIQNFKKLIGKDLIVAHQLLKNDIPLHEYWIITRNLTGDMKPSDFAKWMRWDSSVKRSEVAEIPFYYTQLGDLKNQIMADGLASSELDNKEKMLSVEREYDTDIITLFHATGDFQYRHRWLEGVKGVVILNHWLPRVGMKCRCIRKDKDVIIYSTSYHNRGDHIEFTETDEHRNSVTRYILDVLSRRRIRFTLEFYLVRNPLRQLMFSLFTKPKMHLEFRRSLENLDVFVGQLKIPGAETYSDSPKGMSQCVDD